MTSLVNSTKFAPSGSQVSAFAVYKNLIPGVKVYEDHNNSEVTKAKKRRKKKPKTNSSPAISNGGVAETISELAKAKERRKNNHKANSSPIIPNGVPVNVNTSELTKTKATRKRGKRNQKTNSSPVISNGNGVGISVINELNKTKESRKRNHSTNSSPILNGISETPTKLKKAKEMKQVTTQEEPEVTIGESPGGKHSFKWLIHPMPVPEFFSKYWEKKPLLVKRKIPTYYGNLLTSAMLDTMLRNNIIRFGKNIDVTSYTDGERETHNPSGRAMPPVVWDYFVNGCSIRVLNPQTYIESVWKLNSSLQDYLGTFVGANVYLTPKESQGFAPHWDDIEAFVLQLEGRKRWRVYEPLEKLPKASSGNLKDDMIGKPILDVVLEPGDMLYFPRGFIHQANAQNEHSLHITLSCYQNNSYSDFLKEYLPLALDQATMEKIALREGLPRDYLQYMGVAHADREDLADKRASFVEKIKKLAMVLLTDKSVFDFAADQMGKRVIWDSLPPFVEKSEIRATVSSDVNFTMNNGVVGIQNQVELDTKIRLLRANCVRLVIEDGSLKLYYSTDNSLEYHGEEAQYIEMVEVAGPAVEFLIAQYPRYVQVQDIPVDIEEDMKLQIVTDLWEKGILRTKE